MALKQVLVLSCVIALISASAIPMWEYLSKDEKMAYLYNMFANQVEEFCKTHTMEDCTKELLKYGLKNLHGMPEDHLDIMDPYQRNANDLIWKSMMEGHKMMEKKTKIDNRFTTSIPDKDAYDFFSESNYLGSASSRQETVLNLSGNTLSKTENPIKTTKHYGPMVVKVHLDGRPVQEEKLIPSDDDEHHYHIVKTKVPHPSHFETRKLNSFPIYKTNSPYPYAVYTRPARR